MRKTRRIEITAFRRQIVVHSADGPGTGGARPSVPGDDGTFDLTTNDSDEGPASHHDATPAVELALLVETLIGSEGAASKALRLAERSGESEASPSSPDQKHQATNKGDDHGQKYPQTISGPNRK